MHGSHLLDHTVVRFDIAELLKSVEIPHLQILHRGREKHIVYSFNIVDLLFMSTIHHPFNDPTFSISGWLTDLCL